MRVDRTRGVQQPSKLKIAEFDSPYPLQFKKVDMKKPSVLSRGTEIDIEKCSVNVGGRFDLVLIATARAREISRKHRDDGETSQVNSCVSAILEIQNGKIGREYLRKVR